MKHYIEQLYITMQHYYKLGQAKNDSSTIVKMQKNQTSSIFFTLKSITLFKVLKPKLICVFIFKNISYFNFCILSAFEYHCFHATFEQPL